MGWKFFLFDNVCIIIFCFFLVRSTSLSRNCRIWISKKRFNVNLQRKSSLCERRRLNSMRIESLVQRQRDRFSRLMVWNWDLTFRLSNIRRMSFCIRLASIDFGEIRLKSKIFIRKLFRLTSKLWFEFDWIGKSTRKSAEFVWLMWIVEFWMWLKRFSVDRTNRIRRKSVRLKSISTIRWEFHRKTRSHFSNRRYFQLNQRSFINHHR